MADTDKVLDNNEKNWLGREDKEVINTAGDPFKRFDEWFEDAKRSEVNDPNAMSIATVDETGMPNLRMVLLKGFDERGFVFYTNYEGVKGQELLANPKAAMCMHWKSLRRQVRVRGAVEQVSNEEADAYFATRHKTSQIGAWASQQSRPLESRFHFEQELARYTAKFNIGTVPRPPHWSGFRIVPIEMEFWQDRKFRLHDRVRFTRETPEAGWSAARLFP